MAYPTSEAYKTAVAQNSRTWRLRINMSLDTQQQLELTESDVTLGSLVFEEASTCSEVIDVGSTYANSLDFSIYNPDHKYDGYSFTYAWLTASVGLQTGENEDGSPIWEDIPLGQFFVQEEGKKMSTIPLKCLDRMVKLNVPFNNIPLLASDRLFSDHFIQWECIFIWQIYPRLRLAVRLLSNAALYQVFRYRQLCEKQQLYRQHPLYSDNRQRLRHIGDELINKC